MERLKSVVRRLFNVVGLDVTRHLSPNTIEGHLHRLLPSLDINCVIDVGGHYGEYAGLLRSIGYKGRIVSFEPVSRNFAILQRARGHDAGWRGMQMALGPETGSMDINVMAATDLSSFLPPSAFAEETFGSSSRVESVEKVAVRRLDDVFAECVQGIAQPRVFLKLDTQGFDSAVLAGARERLGDVLALQTEVAVRPLYEGMPLFPQSLVNLTDLGFELTGLFGVGREHDHIAQIEFDCVVRRPRVKGAANAGAPASRESVRGSASLVA